MKLYEVTAEDTEVSTTLLAGNVEAENFADALVKAFEWLALYSSDPTDWSIISIEELAVPEED